MHTVRGDAISSLLYVSNWWFIFHDLSYFDSFGSPSPLKNLWSLAIEEQFYFIWPIILLLGIYIFKKRERFAAAVVLCALCSAIWMSILYVPGGDPSRVYYGTDTRAFEPVDRMRISPCVADEKAVWEQAPQQPQACIARN